jgi:hypothetical protein
MNFILNTNSSGTGQQTTVASGAISALTTMRLIDVMVDMRSTAKTASIYIDGTLVTTGLLSNCVGGVPTAPQLRIGTSADSRFASCVIKEIVMISGASDLAREQGSMAWRNGMQSQLPANHTYKNAAP